MRKCSFFVLFALIICLSFVSCSKKRTIKDAEADYVLQPEMILAKSDTTEVLSLTNLFLNNLKYKKLDNAIAMLYYLNKEKIVALPKTLEKRERMTMGELLGCPKYTIDNVIFLKETDCKVSITVTLFNKKPGENIPNQSGLIINPVRRNGKWYLTLADSQTDSDHGTEIKN
jgi:hypothetical protein